MSGIAIKLGFWFPDITVLRSVFQAIQDPSDVFGSGMAFVENRRAFLIKSLKRPLGKVSDEAKELIQDSIPKIISGHIDLCQKSSIIMGHCRRPSIGAPNIDFVQPFLSPNRGNKLLMMLQGTINNYKSLYPYALNDTDALSKWLMDENFTVFSKIQGSANIVFSYVHLYRDPIVYVYSTNISPLFHCFYHNVHFISSNRNSLSLLQILENDLEIDEVPQDILLKYTVHLSEPIICKWNIQTLSLLMGLSQD